jgi:hypothetical protein
VERLLLSEGDTSADRAQDEPGPGCHADAAQHAGEGLSITPPGQRSPAYLANYLPQEIERWGKVIRAGAISMD